MSMEFKAVKGLDSFFHILSTMKERITIGTCIMYAALLAAVMVIPLSPGLVTGGFSGNEYATAAISVILGMTCFLLSIRNYDLKTHPFIFIATAVLLLIIYSSFNSHPGTITRLRSQWLAVTLTFYLSFRVLFSREKSGNGNAIIMLTIAGTIIWQSGLLLLQLAGLARTDSNMGFFDGSFTNPGLIGGFLAISLTALIPFTVRKERHDWLWVTCIIAITMGLIALPATLSRASVLAFSACLATWLIKRRQFRIAIGMACMALAAGIYAYGMKKESADIRGYMAKACITLLSENNWKGFGPGTFPQQYARYQMSHFASGRFTEKERLSANVPTNCCNELIESGMEYGLPFMLTVLALAIWVIYRGIRQGVPWSYPLMAWAAFSLFSYPTVSFMLRYLGALSLAGTVTGICNGPESSTTSMGTRKTIAMTLPCGLVACACITAGNLEWTRQRITATREFGIGQIWYDQGDFRTSVRNWERICQHMDHSSAFLFQYGVALNQVRQYRKSDSILHVCEQLSMDPMIRIIMGDNALAMNDMELAEACYRQSFLTVPNRITPLARLADLYHLKGDSARYAGIVEEMKSFIPKIDNHTVRSIRNGYIGDN